MQKTLFDHPVLCGVLSRPAAGILHWRGWRIEGELPNLSKYVVVAAPHTSNWDFVILLFTVLAMRGRMYWFGKHTAFRWPLGPLFRWLGGIAIDRTQLSNTVEQSIAAFQEREQFVLVIPPEGSRKKTRRWKSGFYYIAKGAAVPVVLAYMDYERKLIRIAPAFHPTEDTEADMAHIREFYGGVAGKYAAEWGPIQFT